MERRGGFAPNQRLTVALSLTLAASAIASACAEKTPKTNVPGADFPQPTATRRPVNTPEPQNTAPGEQDYVKIGKKAPDFEVTDQNGNSTRISDFIGKNPVVIYFWIPNCGRACNDVTPIVAQVKQAYEPQGLVVLPIANEGLPNLTRQIAPAYLAEDYPDLSSHYKVDGVPAAVLIRIDGTIASILSQKNDFRGLDNQVRQILSK